MIKHNIHAGEFLKEVLEDLEISAYKLAKDTQMPKSRISHILKGERSITPDTAVRLSKYLGMSAQYWMNLQTSYDLTIAENSLDIDILSVA